MDHELVTASDLEFQDKMKRPKAESHLSKQDRKKDKNFRQKRQNARGRQWL